MRMPKTRVCNKCFKRKAISSFYKDVLGPNGKRKKCKNCDLIVSKKWYSKNLMHCRKTALKWRWNNIDKARETGRLYARRKVIHRKQIKKIWQAKNKEKISSYNKKAYSNTPVIIRRAQRQCWKAIKAGKIKRHPCEVCGNKKVHGHHTDYSKPLNVRWLCPTHHRFVHRKYK